MFPQNKGAWVVLVELWGLEHISECSKQWDIYGLVLSLLGAFYMDSHKRNMHYTVFDPLDKGNTGWAWGIYSSPTYPCQA